MHWSSRAILAFGLLGLAVLAVVAVVEKLVPNEFDRALVNNALGILAAPLFFLLYRALPWLVLGLPAEQMQAPSVRRRRWLFSPWWKWCLLVAGSTMQSLHELGQIVERWTLESIARMLHTGSGPILAPPIGFPARLSPTARDLLMDCGRSGVKVLGVVLTWGALCLFWWDWRTPAPPSGHCTKCGYDLTGNVSGRCPECGELVAAQ